jgi:hypothetical protein
LGCPGDAITLLRKDISEEDPSFQSRFTFYLAQSHRDCGAKEQALTNYLRRAEMGGWDEEVFVSLYNAAQLQEALGHSLEEVISTYQRASEAAPGRAEALHGAARFLPQCGPTRGRLRDCQARPGLAQAGERSVSGAVDL